MRVSLGGERERERRADTDATAAAVNFLGGTRLEQDRAVLATLPLFMLFFLLAWMTMLS